jgi:hypothetical protein
MNEQTKQRIDAARAKHLLPANKYGTCLLSISSMMGKKVTDLVGYVSQHFGYDAPVFNVSGVVFEDGTTQHLQGEHDIVYFPADDVPGLTNKDLLLCMDPDDIDEEDDEDFQEYLDAADEDED